jgi:UDP-GlcNAc:undecaprenyl-phosphate GlcNAc-1-phosphate transferase
MKTSRTIRPSRLGGLAVAIAFLIPLGVTLGLGMPGIELSGLQLIALCITTIAVVALGLYDDVYGASALEKLGIQILLAGATWAIGVRIEGFGAFSEYFPLSDAGSLVATVLWTVAVMNAMNLIDGLDGLAAGIGLIAVSTLFSFGWVDGHVLLCLTTATLAGALIGFLIHNLAPAQIFLGDSGSHLLGYVLAVVSILSTAKQYTAWAIALPALALGVPLLDTALAIVRRMRRGQPPTLPDLEHVHHRLLRRGYSTRESVFLLYGIGIGLAAAAWAIKADSAPAQALAIAAAGVVVLIAVRFMVRRDTRGLSQVQRMEPQAASDLARRRALGRAVQSARSIDELWEALLRAMIAQGAVSLHLDLFTRTPVQRVYGNERRSVRRRQLILPLYSEYRGYGELTIEQRRSNDPVLDIQREVQMRLLAESAVDALESMAPALHSEVVVSRLPV